MLFLVGFRNINIALIWENSIYNFTYNGLKYTYTHTVNSQNLRVSPQVCGNLNF